MRKINGDAIRFELGKKYTYRVRSFTHAAGNSLTTNKASAVTVLPMPENFDAVVDQSAGTVTLSWEGILATELGYTVVQWHKIDGTYSAPIYHQVAANETSFTLTPEYGTFGYSVFAWNNESMSAPTPPMDAGVTVPMPTDVYASNLNDGTNGIGVYCTDPPVQGSGGIGPSPRGKSFIVRKYAYDESTGLFGTTPIAEATVGPETFTHTFTNNAPGVTYGFTVEAVRTYQIYIGGEGSSGSGQTAKVMNFDEPGLAWEHIVDWHTGSMDATRWPVSWSPSLTSGPFGNNQTLTMNVRNLPRHTWTNVSGYITVGGPPVPDDTAIAFALDVDGIALQTRKLDVYASPTGVLKEVRFSIGESEPDPKPDAFRHTAKQTTVTITASGIPDGWSWTPYVGVDVHLPFVRMTLATNGSEGGSNGSISVSREGSNTSIFKTALPVKLKDLGGSATSEDYQSISQIEIPPKSGLENGESKTEPVVISNDTISEWVEDTRFQLAPSPNYHIVTTTPRTITMGDNDLGLSLGGSTLNVGLPRLPVNLDVPRASVPGNIVTLEGAKFYESATGGTPVSQWNYSTSQPPATVYAEAMGGSAYQTQPATIKLNATGHDQRTASATIPVQPANVDLRIDSNNNGVITSPSTFPPNTHDSSIEDDLSLPGKLIAVNDDDTDSDGIPDYADGFNYDGIATGTPGSLDNSTAGEQFVPMIVSNFSQAAYYKFDYSASHPSSLTRSGSGTTADPYVYAPAAGALRLWNVAPASRTSGAAVADNGNFIPSGVAVPGSKLPWEYDPEFETYDGPATLMVEAVRPTTTDAERTITLSVDPDGPGPLGFKVTDSVVVTAIEIDVDVDSDNNDGFDPPGRLPLEDQIETDSAKHGKVIAVNDNDLDRDGIPDFADGYDFDETAGTNDDAPPTSAQGENFVPVVIQLPAPLDLSVARLTVTYDYSNPASIGTNPLTRSGAGTQNDPFVYTPGGGHFRLWTMPGNVSRSWKGFRWGPSASTGFIVPANNIADPYYDPTDLAKLGFSSATREITLWAEAVRPSSSNGDQSISIAVDPDGAGPAGFMSLDQARLTSIDTNFIKTWSDQFANVAINYGPGGTGYEGPDYANDTTINEKPYVLMAVRADGKLYAKANFEFTPGISSLQQKLLMTMYTDNSIGQRSYSPQLGSISGNTVSYSTNLPNANEGDFGHAWGLDFNGNGTLEAAEILGFAPRMLRVISADAYASAWEELDMMRDASFWVSRPISKNWLYAFQNDVGLDGAINIPSGAQLSAGEFKLTHNVGAIFNASGVAPVNKAIFTTTSGSPVVEVIAASHGIGEMIRKTFEANTQAVQNWFALPENQNATSKEFTFVSAVKEVKFIGEYDPDLSSAIGDADVQQVSITVTVTKRNDLGDGEWHLVAGSAASLTGVLTDTYDFDFDGDTDPVTGITDWRLLSQKAAELQAGYGTLGAGGHVFKIEAQLNGTTPVPYGFFFE